MTLVPADWPGTPLRCARDDRIVVLLPGRCRCRWACRTEVLVLVRAVVSRFRVLYVVWASHTVHCNDQIAIRVPQYVSAESAAQIFMNLAYTRKPSRMPICGFLSGVHALYTSALYLWW